MTIRRIGTIVGISSILSVSAGAMNLFSNPSFENGAGGVAFSPTTDFGGATAFALTSVSTEIPDWSWEQNGAGGAVWLEDTGNLFGSDGDHLLYLDTNQSVQWEDFGNELVAGATYDFGYNFATWERGQDLAPGDPSSGQGTIFLEYNYRDSGDDLKFGNFTVDLRPDANGDSGPGALTWLVGTESLVIPADYGSEFKFNVTTSGTGILMDNLSLTGIPEPQPVVFVGLGLLLIGSSRRRG